MHFHHRSRVVVATSFILLLSADAYAAQLSKQALGDIESAAFGGKPPTGDVAEHGLGGGTRYYAQGAKIVGVTLSCPLQRFQCNKRTLRTPSAATEVADDADRVNCRRQRGETGRNCRYQHHVLMSRRI